MNKTPCGTSTMGVFGYSRDAEIGLKLKIELSSLFSSSLSNLLCELSIFPALIAIRSCLLVVRGMMSLLRRTSEVVLDKRQTSKATECNLVASYSLRIFDLGQMTAVAIRIPLIEFSSRIGFSSTYVLDHTENLQRVKFVRELPSNNEEQ